MTEKTLLYILIGLVAILILIALFKKPSTEAIIPMTNTVPSSMNAGDVMKSMADHMSNNVTTSTVTL